MNKLPPAEAGGFGLQPTRYHASDPRAARRLP